jgi:cytochrome c oxidase subunit 2
MLRYGDVQVVAAIVFLVLALVIAAVVIVVAADSFRDAPADEVQRKGYRFRSPWLAFLVTLGVIVVGASFFLLPYASGADPDTTVTVSGGQFFWSIDPTEVPAHTQVRFDVTSVDVNHGFGVYDPGGRLIGSTQAMPGYTNELDLRLDEPGRYVVRCFEYCGLSHHLMEATFQVVER